MIQLGSYDDTVSAGDRQTYAAELKDLTGLAIGDVKLATDKLTFTQNKPDANQPMTVKAVQQALKSAGFFPGARVDGICGYRTLSAMRLFQEYIRTREDEPAFTPDGLFGKNSQQRLKGWQDNGETAQWATGNEYAQWLALLEGMKQDYTANPHRMLKMVNEYEGESDTRSVADWDFGADGNIHLIGIRRDEKRLRFDDIFVLLIKGLVFKFQGSTEPGSSQHPDGAPFLVYGQHDYRVGWHRGQYLALRPRKHGVLVVRSKEDLYLDDSDLDGGLEPNASINIHWAGLGLRNEIKNWSEGCQVINGSYYINDANELVDCSAFAARNNENIQRGKTTRGAYNVLVDLVAALGSDLRPDALKYTLIDEDDVQGSDLEEVLADARAQVAAKLGLKAEAPRPLASNVAPPPEPPAEPAPAPVAPAGADALDLDWEQLATVFVDAEPDYLKEVAAELNQNLARCGLETRLRQAHFFAQVLQETGTRLHGRVESMNYKPEALRSHFAYYRDHPDEADEDGYLRDARTKTYIRRAQEEVIANKVYANRIGNGDVDSGDGWRYRGRGFIQVTGRSNYAALTDTYARIYGERIDFVAEPELLEEFPYTVRSAVCFWRSHGLPALADAGDAPRHVDAITKVVNRYTDSYADRRDNFEELYTALA